MRLTRNQAIDLLYSKIQNQNLRRHCLSVEAAMKALAEHFGQDSEIWGIVGLLHDGDYEQTKEDMANHSILMAKWVRELGEDDEVLLHAIESHGASHRGTLPTTTLEKCLFCCDELTGLIVATALMTPNKKLADVDVDSVIKKFYKPKFAAGARREDIIQCETLLKLPLKNFIGIVLKGMQTIDEEIGL